MPFVEQLVIWEKDLFLWLNSFHSPTGDAFMYLISSRWPWVGMGIVFLAYIFYKRPLKESLFLLLFLLMMVTATDQISSSIIKPFFARLRPTWHPITAAQVVDVYNNQGWGYGFVSSHAANFLAIASFSSLTFRNRLYTFLIFSLTIAVSYSRIYLGVHFISDVVGGAILGIVLGFLFYKAYSYYRTKVLNPKASVSQVFSHSIEYLNLLLGFFILLLFSFSIEFVKILERVLS